jgi:hypothetical protein
MTKKISIDFNLKIPRSNDHTFTILVPVAELVEGGGDDPSIATLTEFVMSKLCLNEGGIMQLRILNGREVVAAWKNARTANTD